MKTISRKISHTQKKKPKKQTNPQRCSHSPVKWNAHDDNNEVSLYTHEHDFKKQEIRK